MISKPGNLVDYQILVTGASGFLGRRLIRRLLAGGAYVVGLDLASFAMESEKPQKGRGTFIHRVGDVSSIDFLSQAVKELRAGERSHSAFFHLSGLTHVEQCQANPYMAFQQNVTQTAQVLEACRTRGLTRILYPSTALVYGEDSVAVLTEEHPPRPESIYASTKLAAEAVIRGYAGSYCFSCDIARLSNVYGAGGNPETAVSTALRQARLGGPVELRSLGPVRDFTYCEDVAEGFIRLLTSGDEPGCRVFNLSTGQGTSIGQMANMVCEIAGIKGEIIISKGGDAQENSRLVLANEKLVKRTAWVPAFSISKGLKATWQEMGK
jgi:nucleoside-diphosphate-sugar epimerase